MKTLVRPELPTAALRSSQATHAAVDNSAPSAIRPDSTYKSGKVVQTNGATSAKGYAVCLNYHIPGVSGIAVSIPKEGALPFLAITNIAITSRLVGLRQKFLADLLFSEASDLSKYLSQLDPASSESM